MRTIKFRGGDIDSDAWFYGNLEYCQATKKARIHTYDCDGKYESQHSVDSDTIGQYTGLCDKNEKEIYEGDILEDADLRYEVCWYDEIAAFMAEDIESKKPFLLFDLDLRETVVIGNIFDNPDLLNGK